MFKWFQRKTPDTPKSPAPKKTPASDERSPDVYGTTKIPRYPPFMEGIPGQSVTAGRMLEDQAKLIKRIRHSVGNIELWAHYHDAIHAYTNYVHLLPASERHHHRGAGGLLRHGLECGAFALELARDIIIAPQETPRRRKIIEPRWMLGLFIAALCHDIGKPATDVEVVDEQGNAWNPMDVSLTEWTQAQHVDRYFLRWRSPRHKLHEALTGLLVDRVLTSATRSWMAIAGSHVLIETLGALTGTGDTLVGEMARLVKQADQFSTQQDLSDQPFTSFPETGVPVDSFIIDAMRGLYREHPSWEVNKPGGRLWFMNDSLFIVWPKGGQEVTEHLKKTGTRGIPSAPDSLADILIERAVAVAPAAAGRYWVLIPDSLQKNKTRQVALTALQLSDYKLLIKHAPPVETGQLIAESEWTGGTDTSTHAVPDTGDPASSSDTNMDAMLGSPGLEKPSPTPKPQSDLQKSTDGMLSLDPNQKQPQKQPKLNEKTITPKSARDWLSQYGLAGTVLEHFAEDVSSGHKQWEHDLTWLNKNKQLAIRYPSAINGYGVEPSAWLGQCFDLGWLAQDRHNPMKRLFDTPIGGASHRCALLEGEVCSMLSVLFDVSLETPHKQTSEKPQAETPAQKKPTINNTPEPSPQPANKHALPHKTKPDNPWPDFLAALKAQQNNTPKLEKREGKTVVDERDAIQWYADTVGQTRSKLRIALSKQTESTRFIKIDNKGHIHVE